MDRRRLLMSALVTALTALGGAGAAHADRDHFELEYAFLAGTRAYDTAHFSYEEGGASPAVLGPFQGEPFSGVRVAGIDTETRLVLSHIRMTLGYARPYPRFTGPMATTALGAGGDPLAVQVRAISTTEWRFGIGAEYDIDGGIVAFADLLGTIDDVDADLVVDQEQSTYHSAGFHFSLRGGVRIPIKRQFFLHGAGELGVDGNIGFGARIGVGVRIN